LGSLRIFSTFLGPLFGLAVLFALLAGGYFLFKYVVGIFATLEPQIETLAAIASVVALLCAVIIAEGLKALGQKDDRSTAAAEKVQLYERLLFLCCEQLKTLGTGDQRIADAELVEIEHRVALHGSAKVISAYVELRRLAKQVGHPGDAISVLVKKLLMEMRRDLGRTEFVRNENDLFDMLLERTEHG
jgi:hypothetical protein